MFASSDHSFTIPYLRTHRTQPPYACTLPPLPLLYIKKSCPCVFLYTLSLPHISLLPATYSFASSSLSLCFSSEQTNHWLEIIRYLPTYQPTYLYIAACLPASLSLVMCRRGKDKNAGSSYYYYDKRQHHKDQHRQSSNDMFIITPTPPPQPQPIVWAAPIVQQQRPVLYPSYQVPTAVRPVAPVYQQRPVQVVPLPQPQPQPQPQQHIVSWSQPSFTIHYR